jgi:hypothetical protein
MKTKYFETNNPYRSLYERIGKIGSIQLCYGS